MIADTINQKIAEALKSKDEIRLSTLRMLSSALNYEFIAKQHKLSEEEELFVVRREVKKRKDAIEALNQARGKSTSSDADTLEKRLMQEQKEMEILEEYLPIQLQDDEVDNLVNQVIKEMGIRSLKDMGRVIGEVMKRAEGKAEGSKVAMLVKTKLS